MEKMKIFSPKLPFTVMKSLLIFSIALLVCQSAVFAQGVSYEQVGRCCDNGWRGWPAEDPG
jgi:hypothetical protein